VQNKVKASASWALSHLLTDLITITTLLPPELDQYIMAATRAGLVNFTLLYTVQITDTTLHSGSKASNL